MNKRLRLIYLFINLLALMILSFLIICCYAFDQFSAGAYETVFFVNSEIGWSVGHSRGKGLVPKSSFIDATTDGGRSWKEQLLWPKARFGTLFFMSPKVGWVAGTDGIIKTEDGGLRWKTQITNLIVSKLEFVNEQNGCAIGKRNPKILGLDHLEGLILCTEDGGYTWVKTLSVEDEIMDIKFVDQHTGWCVGRNGKMWKTRDGGKNWGIQSPAFNEPLRRVFFINQSRGWIASAEGSIFHTSDGGQTWSKQYTETGVLIGRILFVDEKTGWVFWNHRLKPLAALLSTKDGGHTWNQSYEGTSLIIDSFILTKHLGWLLTSQGLFKMADGSERWQEIHSF